MSPAVISLITVLGPYAMTVLGFAWSHWLNHKTAVAAVQAAGTTAGHAAAAATTAAVGSILQNGGKVNGATLSTAGQAAASAAVGAVIASLPVQGPPSPTAGN